MDVIVCTIYCILSIVCCCALNLSFADQRPSRRLSEALLGNIRPRFSTTMSSHASLASHFQPRGLSSTLHWKLALCPRSLPPRNLHLANYPHPLLLGQCRVFC